VRDTRTPRGWAVLVGVIAVGPLLVLPLQAVADVWRSPALLPQRFGARGLDVLVSAGTRVPEAVTVSLVVALVATVVALLLGWPAARALAAAPRAVRLPLLAALAVPLLVPPFATGTGLVAWFLQLGLSDRVTGLVAAHLVYVLPYTLLILTPAFDADLRRLEEAAATAGAGRLTRLRLVSLPATVRPLTVAGLLGFLVSWSQYGTSLAVGGGTLTLPVVLLPFVGHDPQVAAALSLVFLLPPLVVLVAARRLWHDPA
jgi:putative spermidine/putrescine transport system permease protein